MNEKQRTYAVNGVGWEVLNPRPQLPRIRSHRTPQYTLPHSAKDICASTTFRTSEGLSVDFATKLFLRVEKAVLEATPTVFMR